jgi:hypothetical protein
VLSSRRKEICAHVYEYKRYPVGILLMLYSSMEYAVSSHLDQSLLYLPVA